MTPKQTKVNFEPTRSACRSRGFFNNIKFFVFCHGMLQLAQLMVSGYLKGSISTIERRYGFTSQKSGVLASFNEVGNTVLIVFVSYFGSRVHRPRCIGVGALIASLAAFLMSLPHFISGPYKYTDYSSNAQDNSSGLCQSESVLFQEPSNQSCTTEDRERHRSVYPILLMGQLLLGIGGVPIQPFGISYIDDYASKKNSPFYLGILLTITVIGPAFGYLMGSVLLNLYVDFMSPVEIRLTKEDPRWVGAWWLGFLISGAVLFLTSLPYLFFPKKMKATENLENCEESTQQKLSEETKLKTEITPALSFTKFLKSFPHILLRTLRNPIYLLVVLAQVNLAAMVAGLATFMPKFIERQFTQTASFSNMMIGGVNIPAAMLGIMTGGIIMRKVKLSVKALAAMCALAILVCIVFAIPLLFLGCSTQRIAGVYPVGQNVPLECSLECSCADEAFNPVCGANGIEFRSPCHAGCKISSPSDNSEKVLNYTDCGCVQLGGSSGHAVPGTCGSGCAHLILPFVILSSLTCFVASISHTPSFIMILRTVVPEDKSFALGIQFMLFRVLAFLPAPVLYGSAIDSTCILWGKKCGKNTSCNYFDLDLFRQRFLGLQAFFLFGGMVCFLLSFFVLRRISPNQQQQQAEKRSSIVKLEKHPETMPRQLLIKSDRHCDTFSKV